MNSVDQLTENDVVDAVCRYLEARHFSIKQRLNTTQRGDDIKATGDGVTLCIEAKGATSSRLGSERFGRPFDSAQVHVHVAEAVYKAIQVLSSRKQGERLHAGIALPANFLHQREVDTVKRVLGLLGIVIFWVSSLDHVEEVRWDQNDRVKAVPQ